MAYNWRMNEQRPRVSLKERFDSLRKTYRGNAVKPEAILLSQPGEFDVLCDIMESPLPPEGERAFIVSSPYGWSSTARSSCTRTQLATVQAA
jgi:hypothetical protein